MQNIKHLSKWTWYLIVFLTILLSIVVTIGRLLTPVLSQYGEELETWLNNTLQKEVEVGKVHAVWRGSGPAINFESLKVYGSAHLVAFELKDFYFAVKLSDLIKGRTLLPTHVHVGQAVLNMVEQPDSTLTVLGFANEKQTGDPVEVNQVMSLLENLIQLDIDALHFSVAQYTGREIYFDNIALAYQHKGNKSWFEAQHNKSIDNQSEDLLFKAEMTGNWKNPEELKGKLYAKVKQFSLDENAWISNYLPELVEQGKLSTELWASFDHQQLSEASGEFHIEDVALTSERKFNEPSSRLSASGHWAWEPLDGGWLITGDELQIGVGNHIGPLGQFRLEKLRDTDTELNKYSFRSEQLSIDGMAELYASSIALPLQQEQLAMNLQPKGTLSNTLFEFWDEPGQAWRYRVETQFDNLSINQWRQYPGLQGLSGRLKANQNTGLLTFDSAPITVRSDHMQQKQLEVALPDGEVSWKKQDSGYLLNLNRLALSVDDFMTDISMQLEMPLESDKKIGIELLVEQKGEADAKTLKKILPIGLIGEKFAQWFERSLQAGRLSDGHLIIRGPLAAIPFDNGEGVLSANLKIKDGILTYHPKWPTISGLDADLAFKGRVFEGQVFNGASLGVNTTAAAVKILNIGKKGLTDFQLSLSAEDKLERIAPFIAETPLHEKFAKTFDLIKLKGDMQLDLDLAMVLEPGYPDKTHLKGLLATENSALSMPEYKLDYSNLSGSLSFTEQGLYSNNLTANLFNEVLKAQLDTVLKSGKTEYIELNLDVPVKVSKLAEQYPSKLWSNVSGRSDLTVTWRGYDKKQNKTDFLRFQSDLKGTAIKLPAPLDKSASVSWPSQVEIQFNQANEHKVIGKIGQSLQINSLLTQSDASTKEWALQRVVLAFGDAPAETDQDELEQGLIVRAKLPALNLDRWREMLSKHSNAEEVTALTVLPLKSVELAAEEVTVATQALTQFDMSMIPEDNEWKIVIVSEQFAGNIAVPQEAPLSNIKADMAHCVFSEANSKQTSLGEYKLKDMPDIALNCHKLRYHDRDYGVLTVNAFHNNKNYESRIKLSDSKYKLLITADWLSNQTSRIKGDIDFTDLGHLIKVFGLKSDIAKSHGEIKFDFDVDAPLLNTQLRVMSGEFSINMKEGRIVEADSSMGRFISLFSLQNVQRRLRLDFSDVFKEGYSFDTFEGDFQLDKGIAYTSNTNLNGGSAMIELSGYTDMVKETLDIELQVMPHVTSTLPLAAAVATGNPAVGAAVWVVDKLFQPKINKLTKYKYLLTGPWDKPVIEPISS